MKNRIVAVFMGVAVCTSAFVGCAAGPKNRPDTGGSGGSGGEASISVGSGSSSSGGGFTPGTGGGGGAGSGCAKFSAEAQQAPAAMLMALDMSASMTKQAKWGNAQLAVVNAIDKDAFDSMSLGLVTFPSSFTDPPQCLCDGICAPIGGCDIATCKMFLGSGVSCGVSFLPQVAIAPAGTDKSAAAVGVRHNIYDYLINHNPLSNADDGSPIYDALSAAYSSLKSSSVDRRIAVLITDGGFSCTSLASPPRPGYVDGNGCNDWENPDSVNALIKNARLDPNKPINTFVVGVPGSNSVGQPLDGYDTPPYKMRLALSTYAVSGAPDSVDPGCDVAATFTQGGAEPAKPCHIDLSNGAAFDADALAKAISDIRGKGLGCVYDLPAPPPGESIDKSLVNVDITIDAALTHLKKRAMPSDQCLVDGCWDYNVKGQVEIVGKACTDLGAAQSAKVDIVVGCDTVIK